MAAEGDIDWGFARDHRLRLAGRQGLDRTTLRSGLPPRHRFVQRHASIVDAVTGDDYLPVQSLEARTVARFFVHDSLLSRVRR